MNTKRACPKCGSDDLAFMEHAGQLMIYQCGGCGAALALPNLPPPAKPPTPKPASG